MAAIATVTKRIRVGSAGIMLPHYAPFKVAEQFRVLDAIAPGRIDLGLGRAPGSDGRTAFALHPLANERPAQFPSDVRDLMAWVRARPCPRDTRSGRSRPTLRARRRRRSGYSAAPTTARRWRRTSGCPTPSPGSSPTARCGEQALNSTASSTSRARTTPSRTRRCACGRSRPTRRRRRAITSARVPVSGCCAIAASSLRWRRPRPRSPTATRRPRRRAWPSIRNSAFVGTGAQVAERIEELAKRLNVQEMAVVTWATDEAVRRRSYQLLAEAMGFAP